MTTRHLQLLALGFFACSPKADIPPHEFDGATAFTYLQRQVGFGYRIPGTRPHEAQAAWMDSLLRQRADTVVVQSWKHVTQKGDTLPLTNLIARFNPGSRDRLLFLAHWDTRPHSDNPKYNGPHTPVPGANDGASGASVLMGMADALKKSPPKGVGVDLLFVDGEDYGDFEKEKDDVLIGSRYYARHLEPGQLPLYAVLFDLVADKDLKLLPEGQSLLAAPEVVELVWNTAREIGHGSSFVYSPGLGPTLIDDHVELQKVGIRAIDVVDFAYPDSVDRLYWHTPADTLDKVSAQSLQVVGDLGMALVRKAEK